MRISDWSSDVCSSDLAPGRSAGPDVSLARGRMSCAMDATASREPTWDRASHLHAEMFKETEALGGLDVQLIYYRGFGECSASPWVSESAKLLRFMTGVFCLAGRTQIGKVLQRAAKETRQRKVPALVVVGDAMEAERDHPGPLAEIGRAAGG